MSLRHEHTADQEAEAIAAERIRSGASDHKEDGAEALERLTSKYRYRVLLQTERSSCP
jgi:hypothetical protein